MVATELRRVAEELRELGHGNTVDSSADTVDPPAAPGHTPGMASYANVVPTLTESSHVSAASHGLAASPGATPSEGAVLSGSPGATSGSLGATPASSRGKGLVLVAVGGALLAAAVLSVGVVGYVYFQDTPTTGKTAKELRQPQVGLDTLEAYLTQRDSKALSRHTAPAWAGAAKDFGDAARQPGAPVARRASAHFAEGQRQLLEGQFDAALNSYQQASHVDDKWALPHVGTSAVHQARGDREKALEAAQKAQQLDPKLWLAVRASARAYLVGDQPKHTSVILELRRAKELAPDSAILLGELALAFHAAQMDEEAVSNANLALKKDPELVDVRVLLAERAIEKGDGKEALAQASRAVSVSPDNVSAQLAKGDALLLLGRDDEACTTFVEAIRLKKETKQFGAPSARLAQVEAALKKNRLPEPRGAAEAKAAKKSSWLVPRPKPRSSPKPRPPKPKPRSAGSGNTF